MVESAQLPEGTVRLPMVDGIPVTPKLLDQMRSLDTTLGLGFGL